jgi:hypothetical protein
MGGYDKAGFYFTGLHNMKSKSDGGLAGPVIDFWHLYKSFGANLRAKIKKARLRKGRPVCVKNPTIHQPSFINLACCMSGASGPSLAAQINFAC